MSPGEGRFSTGFFATPDGTATTFQFSGVDERGTFPCAINNENVVAGYFYGVNGSVHGFTYAQQGQMAQLDVPGATGTWANRINDLCDVAGSIDGQSDYGGFIYSKGQYSPLSVPGSTNTSISGINNKGQLVGVYVDSSNVTHAFIATPAQ